MQIAAEENEQEFSSLYFILEGLTITKALEPKNKITQTLRSHEAIQDLEGKA